MNYIWMNPVVEKMHKKDLDNLNEKNLKWFQHMDNLNRLKINLKLK
ncbi:hypothetical protein HYH54_04290 [Clostridium botulinum]|nr:hypothetical protein [Clostridium botulinum]